LAGFLAEEEQIEYGLLAGAYRVAITPPLGAALEGSFDFRGAEQILDDLYVNALVLADARVEVAVISVDVCFIPRALFDEMAAEVGAATGIPAEHVIIAATHTHAGPVLEDFDSAGLHPDPAYVALLTKQVASAAGMAQQRKRPVRVGVGRGENRNHVFNRRLRRPDGRIVMNWVSSAELEGCEPSGPVDPEVLAIRFVDECDRVVATILSYANHNNAAPSNAISADMAGRIGEVMRKVHGEDTVTVFLLGACGNTNWLDHTNPECRTPTWYHRMGTAIAGTVLEMEPRIGYPEINSLRICRKLLHISDRPYRDYDVLDDGTFGDGADAFFRAYREARDADEGKELPVNDAEIVAIALGTDIAVVTIPAEAFCEIALEIKARSPFKYTLFSELTNGALGYVPTRQAFDEGGYEVRKVPQGSHLAIDAAERLVGASVALLKEMTKGA
jgi:hypothetical protein